MFKNLLLCVTVSSILLLTGCQPDPTLINSTSQPRDNRSVTNKNAETNHGEANRAETNHSAANSETMNNNSSGNSQMKPSSNAAAPKPNAPAKK